jgi:acyl carrier protein
LELISQLDFLCYAGGPLSQANGEKLNQVTKLCQFYGATEFISVHQLFTTNENWAYIEFNPEAKIRMQRVEDDTYELVILPEGNGESALDFAFPGIRKYETRDLLKPHPTHSGLWKFAGRRDDIIVLSNGEKFNPIPIELTLQGHVAGAFVVGNGRFQAALIIEPKAGTETSNLVDTIWPIVQEANKLVPGQGRITRSMIRLSDPEKPFIRASKGTVIRKMTGRIYEQEIEELYAKADTTREQSTSRPCLGASFKLEDVKDFVREIIKSSFPGMNLNDDDDLYSVGLDSLRALEITKALMSELSLYRNKNELSWFNTSVLYNNASISRLSYALFDKLDSGHLRVKTNIKEEMAFLIAKYTKQLVPYQRSGGNTTSNKKDLVVALIGSSGYLGTALLDKLLKDPKSPRSTA